MYYVWLPYACAPCPFIQEKLDFLRVLSLFLNSFCLNKSRSMPKLQFLTVCEPPGTLTEENVCKVVSNNTDLLQKPWYRICLARKLVEAAVWSENKSLAKQRPWWEVSSLFRRAALSLWGSGPISQARCLVGQRKDYWSFDVCCSVKCQRQSLCIEWQLPGKVLLMCPSVSHPSINHSIRERHISLRTRSETRSASTPFLVFSVSSWRQEHTFPLLFALCLCLFWEADCHIRIVCQSTGNSDKAESIYLSISARPIAEMNPKLANQNAIQAQHPTPARLLPPTTLAH